MSQVDQQETATQSEPKKKRVSSAKQTAEAAKAADANTTAQNDAAKTSDGDSNSTSENSGNVQTEVQTNSNEVDAALTPVNQEETSTDEVSPTLEKTDADELLKSDDHIPAAETPKGDIQERASEETQKQEHTDEKLTLTETQLRITNNGGATHCMVTKTLVPANTVTVITYKNSSLKSLAMRNFAQLNALAGQTRFKVED